MKAENTSVRKATSRGKVAVLNFSESLFLEMVKKLRGVNYISKDGDFTLNGMDFTKSWFSDRYYYLTESSSVHSKWEMVRKRISKACFTKALEECKAKIAVNAA
jgi:hypothetical protein